MHRQPVESSMLASVGYDPVSSVLELEFHGGRVYQYGDVSEETWRELMAAESKGRYFLDYIQEQYPYLRIRSGASRRRR
jgi:hypothetical protein